MENHIPQQLGALGAAVALGAAAALVYDLLRALRLLRRRDRRLTHLLDSVFVAAVGVAALYLMLRIGGGELRLYMLAGLALGALVWSVLLSRLLRPVWEFWAAALYTLGSLLWQPVRWAAGGAKKVATGGKKGFSFVRKYATMKIEKCRARQRGAPEKEEPSMDKRKNTKKQKKRRPNTALLVVLAALMVLLGTEIVKVYAKLDDARREEAALESQLTEQQQENDALRSDLSKKDDETFWKALARDLLGLAEEGERIFYDVND